MLTVNELLDLQGKKDEGIETLFLPGFSTLLSLLT